MDAYRSLAWLALVVGIGASNGQAWAQGEAAGAALDLTVKRAPAIMPASLGMRADKPASVTHGAVSASTPLRSLGKRMQRNARAIFGKRPLSESVIFRFNIGVGLDGGEQTPESRQLSGLELVDYAQLRIYYFGDAVIGSRGIVSPSLSTYLASRFRFDQAPGFASTAIPSVHDAQVRGERVRDVWIRSAYATWQGVGDIRWLEPVYVRAGRQYRYGPAIAHFDGLTVGYDGEVVDLGLFAGRAADVMGLPLESLYRDEALISGFDARIDLYRLNRVPVTLSAELLRFDSRTHMRGAVALRLARDVSLGATVRALDGEIARTGTQLKARLSKVSIVDITVESRTRDDWQYDLFTTVPRSEEPLGYLRLGPSLPRWYVDARAGMVLLDNIDLLVHGGGVLMRALDSDPGSAHAASYAQAGGAIEVRLRRTLGLGISVLARRYARDEPAQDDRDDIPGALFEGRNTAGEVSFVEGGGSLRYTQGARRFSAGAEGYVRYYDTQSPYGDPELFDQPLDPELASDVRGGGRFTVEGWAGDNLRLKAEYDLSTALSVAPALRGIKSLRVLAEGRF